MAIAGAGLAEGMTRTAREEAPADVRLLRLAELQVRYFREHPRWARITTMFVSPGARADLRDIRRYTAQRWGRGNATSTTSTSTRCCARCSKRCTA